jgi:hypothetical protein
MWNREVRIRALDNRPNNILHRLDSIDPSSKHFHQLSCNLFLREELLRKDPQEEYYNRDMEYSYYLVLHFADWQYHLRGILGFDLLQSKWDRDIYLLLEVL